MTLFQHKLVEIIKKRALNGSLSTNDLACYAKTSRLAVWSAMRSLERQNLAGYFRSGEDQWSASMWFLREQNPEMTL